MPERPEGSFGNIQVQVSSTLSLHSVRGRHEFKETYTCRISLRHLCLCSQAALCILEDLASANNLCREAIVIHSGVPVLMQAAEGCSGRARRAVAGKRHHRVLQV